MPFLRLSGALAAGILLGSAIRISSFILLISIALALYVLRWINRRYRFHLTLLFGAGVHIIFVFTGMYICNKYNRKPLFHYEGKFCAEVTEIMQEKPNSFQTVLNIRAVFRNDTVYKYEEKVLTWFAKSEKARLLNPGDIILFNSSPQKLKNNNNPYEFDYKNYLSRRKIYRQLFLPEEGWIRSDLKTGFSVAVFAERVRMQLLENYRRQIPGEKALNILSALTLGYKRGLGPDTKRTFSSAGAMHVLAVSGLHTGIIFLILSSLCGFMKRRMAGRFIFVIVVIAALWFFAFVTGLSPSVKRAATMFSFVVAGDGMNRKSNIYNTLAASAFFLLLFNPNNLFDAGFQLSYAAVFGIVCLKPEMDKLISAGNKITRYMWSLIAVTASAQISTFPLSAWYFNQFPVYGWLSNILVIPLVTLLIPLGMMLLICSFVPVFATILAAMVNFILCFMIRFLEQIESLPLSVLELSYTRVEMICILGFFLCFFCFIKKKNTNCFKALLFSFLLLSSASLAVKTHNLFRREIIVYNHFGQTILHLISGRKNYIVSETKIQEGEVAMNMIGKTVCKLEMDDPVFLTSNQGYRDSRLYLKNELICFEGKIIILGDHPGSTYFYPHFLIGPFNDSHVNRLHAPGQKIISTLRGPQDFLTDTTRIFFLNHEGAFRENW